MPGEQLVARSWGVKPLSGVGTLEKVPPARGGTRAVAEDRAVARADPGGERSLGKAATRLSCRQELGSMPMRRITISIDDELVATLERLGAGAAMGTAPRRCAT